MYMSFEMRTMGQCLVDTVATAFIYIYDGIFSSEYNTKQSLQERCGYYTAINSSWTFVSHMTVNTEPQSRRIAYPTVAILDVKRHNSRGLRAAK